MTPLESKQDVAAFMAGIDARMASIGRLFKPLPCTAGGLCELRRGEWDRERKGWPTVCKSCGAEGFTDDPRVPRLGAVSFDEAGLGTARRAPARRGPAGQEQHIA